MNAIEKGTLLIAAPFLKDADFQRSVVLLCEHQLEGSFGIILNKKTEETIGLCIEELNSCGLPVYNGGPVNRDHIHFLHQHPASIQGGQHVADGTYWGGDFKAMTALVNSTTMDRLQIRFFRGYAGWGNAQLETEMKEKSWLTVAAQSNIVFHQRIQSIWTDSVKLLGDEFLPIINYPLDPSYN